MARLRYNNTTGTLGASLSNSGTTITFASPPGFATLTGTDYIPLVLDPPVGTTPNASFEIVWLTAYTAGQTTGTMTRGRENTSGVAHANGAVWCCAPTSTDFANVGGPQTSLTGLTQGVEAAASLAAPGSATLLYAVTVSQPCRVRLYATTAQATADRGRSVATDPAGNHGCLFELVMTAAGTFNCSPEVFIVDQDSPSDFNFAANVRCDSGTSLAVTLTGMALVP